jgi:hypothetical protein
MVPTAIGVTMTLVIVLLDAPALVALFPGLWGGCISMINLLPLGVAYGKWDST